MTTAATVTELREAFNAGLTRDVAWRRDQLENLSRMVTENESVIADALAADLGKSPTESLLTELSFLKTEVAHTLKHLAGWVKPRRANVPVVLQPASAKIVAEPLGVALIIAPWNYPFLLALSPLVGAIAAGNAAIVKPSELAPKTSEAIAKLVPVYLDQRAVRVIEGGVPETTELLAQRFDHIFYTGNSTIARVVMRAAVEHLTPVTLELGGKSPAYVDTTVNLKQAAKRIAWGKFVNSGQTCVAPDYVLATQSVLDELAGHIAEAVRDMFGSAIEKNPDYGRIVNLRHFERLDGFLALARNSEPGAGDIVVGGESNEKSLFVEPSVLMNVSRDASIMEDEIFGPILPLIPVEDLDDAIRCVNEREKPLALYVFSEDAPTRARWQHETSSGAIGFNAPVLHLSALDLPFGGVGASGMGSYHGQKSFDAFSHYKPMLSKPLSPDTLASTVMPPYTDAKSKLLRKLLP